MVKIEKIEEATARIESALYSAGRPLRIEDLIRASGTESRTKTLEILKACHTKIRCTSPAFGMARLQKLGVWDLKSVRNWSDVAREARLKNKDPW